MIKIYVEVKDGMVIGAYTDNKEPIDFILCDHDNAAQETAGDAFEFESTNNCNELEANRNRLNCIY